MSEPDLKELKRELRKSASGALTVKPKDLTERFLSLPQVKQAEIIMLYVGTGEETDTIPLIEQILNMGKKVVLPLCLPERKMEVREIKTVLDLAPGKFKIPEPGQHCPIVPKENVDIVLVPYVLCDRNGYRLGHGGGYYDRWLSDFRGTTVAICSKERLVEHLPREPHDKPVDLLVVV